HEIGKAGERQKHTTLTCGGFGREEKPPEKRDGTVLDLDLIQKIDRSRTRSVDGLQGRVFGHGVNLGFPIALMQLERSLPSNFRLHTEHHGLRIRHFSTMLWTLQMPGERRRRANVRCRSICGCGENRA